MTDLINITPQNTKNGTVESKTNSKNGESEFNFLSIMQSEMNKVNISQNSQNTANKTEKTTDSNTKNLKDLKSLTKENPLLKENLSLVAKSKLNVELKNIENQNELKSAKNMEDLIKIANEKGLKVENLNLKKLDSEKTTELKTLKSLNSLQKSKEKTTTLENEKLLAIEKLQTEKVTKEKDLTIASLLKDSTKENSKDNTKEVLGGAFSLESLLQKDENTIGKKVKRDKFTIETLKQDKVDSVDTKKDISLDLRLDSNAKSLAEVEVKNKMVEAKSTINSFATTLKEQVENYKPPIMKLSLSLNPKELGNVDVTILSRGNSLQVNLASNNQAMQLFAQNATEFKNALANIGFENVEMNFNSNSDQSGQNGQNSQDGQSQRGFKYYADNNLNFSVEDNLHSIDLIIPDYA